VTGIELNADVVSANYFGALDLPLMAGQMFPDHRIPGQGRVGAINQEAADLYFNGKPLGAGVIDDNTGVRTEMALKATFRWRKQPGPCQRPRIAASSGSHRNPSTLRGDI